MPYWNWNRHSNFAARCIHIAASASILVSIGCGPGKQDDPNRAAVSGNISFDGKPLPAGTVTFASAEGNTASTVSIEDGGRYATDRAPLGPNMVTIDTASIQYGNPTKYVPIPARYNDPTQSGLTADIKPGVNENVNFDLEK